MNHRCLLVAGFFSLFLSMQSFAETGGTVRIGSSATSVQALLGSGYSSQKEKFEEGCITGITKFAGAQASDISFSQITSQADLANSLGFQAGARVRYGMVSVSAEAKFFSSSQSTNYSLSAVYSANYKFKNEILTAPTLTELGKSVRQNDERWLSACGDEYVWQRELGARFFFSIKIDFASEVDKQYFETNFSLGSPPLALSAGLQKAKDRMSKRTTVTISALQIGGSVEKLTEMFGNAEDRVAYVQCSTGEFQKCHNILRSALDYATDVRTGFPSQISPTSGTENPSGPAVLAYHTRPYKGAGIWPVGYPLLEDAVKQSREDLSLTFEQLYQDRIKTQQILFSKSLRSSQRQRELLLETDKILETNKNKILAASQICYETPFECPSKVARLIGTGGELKAINRSAFLIRPESFSQYCDLAHMPEPDPGIKTTVDAIIQEARRIDGPAFQATAEGLDECSVTEDIIRRANRISLANKGIRDLRPLENFTHLEAIDLRENQIADVKPLSSLTALRELDLSKNRIRSLIPLSGLKELKRLNLADNRIADAKALASLANMERLDLRNNEPRLGCPYPELERCITGDFKATNSFVAIQLGRSYRTQHAASRLTNGRVLVTGGWDERGPLAEIYDEHSRMVPTRGAMNKARSGHTSTLLNDGRVLITGGWAGGSTAEIYDPISDTFSNTLSSMRVNRAAHTATLLLDGTVLITGGWNGIRWTGAERDSSASAEIFDPKSNRFLPVGSLKFRRADHTATRLKNGTVLIAGGFTQGGGLPTAEIYDPATKEFHHAKWRMTTGRGGHTATALPNGDVLLVGGWWDDASDAWKTSEIYEAQTEVFRTTRGESMHSGRAWHTSSLLSDGRILVAGGMSAWDLDMKTCAKCLDTAEIFDPGSEMFTTIPKVMSAPRVFHTATALDDMMVLILGGAADGSSRTGDIYEYKR